MAAPKWCLGCESFISWMEVRCPSCGCSSVIDAKTHILMLQTEAKIKEAGI